MTISYSSAIDSQRFGAQTPYSRRKSTVKQDPAAFDETSLSSWLRDIVKDRIDLFRVSDRLNLNPSTVQKILEGHPMSQCIAKKIEAAIQGGDLFNEKGSCGGQQKPNHSTIERFMEVYRLYQEEKNLKLVGIKLGICRERVRQLLKKGAEIGLFKYQPQKPPPLSREKILRDFGRFLKYKEVAKANCISTRYLCRLMERYCITQSDLAVVLLEGRKRQCIKQYLAVAERLGRHPNTAELQRSKATRSLEYRIRRSWGSLDRFRKELDVVPGRLVGSEAPVVFRIEH